MQHSAHHQHLPVQQQLDANSPIPPRVKKPPQKARSPFLPDAVSSQMTAFSHNHAPKKNHRPPFPHPPLPDDPKSNICSGYSSDAVFTAKQPNRIPTIRAIPCNHLPFPNPYTFTEKSNIQPNQLLKRKVTILYSRIHLFMMIQKSNIRFSYSTGADFLAKQPNRIPTIGAIPCNHFPLPNPHTFTKNPTYNPTSSVGPSPSSNAADVNIGRSIFIHSFSHRRHASKVIPFCNHPPAYNTTVKSLMQTAVWDDLVGRSPVSRSGAKRAHCRTFYLLNDAIPANRRLNRTGRTAARYEGERPKSDANPMVAYSFSFSFFNKKRKKEGKPINIVYKLVKAMIYSDSQPIKCTFKT
jgi:hypothetical protein